MRGRVWWLNLLIYVLMYLNAHPCLSVLKSYLTFPSAFVFFRNWWLNFWPMPCCGIQIHLDSLLMDFHVNCLKVFSLNRRQVWLDVRAGSHWPRNRKRNWRIFRSSVNQNQRRRNRNRKLDRVENARIRTSFFFRIISCSSAPLSTRKDIDSFVFS